VTKIKILNFIKSFFVSALKILEYKVKELEYVDAKKKWDLETGEKFNDIINKYSITEERLIKARSGSNLLVDGLVKLYNEWTNECYL